MASLLPGVALEALAGFTKKVGRHAQVHLRVTQVDVAQIDRQGVEESLHVDALLVPGSKAVNGERMPLMPSSA
jgi:hypothetical protein